jgi:hypothetical protein
LEDLDGDLEEGDGCPFSLSAVEAAAATFPASELKFKKRSAH